MMIDGRMLGLRKAIFVVAASSFIVACASGAGGGGPQPLPPTPPQPPPNPQPQENLAWSWGTGLSGQVGAPVRASFGSGGPTFDPNNESDVTFPVTFSSLEATSDGLSGVSSNDGATVTFGRSGYAMVGTLSIPVLNLEVQLWSDPIDVLLDLYSYVTLGMWAEPQSKSGPYGSITAFAFGYETPASAMPTNGTATFYGEAGATVLKPVDGSIRAAYVRGNATLDVDFASGKISGAFTNMNQSQYVSYAGPGSHSVTGQIIGGVGTIRWNDVAVTATIAGGSSRFSGSTAATNAPNTAFSLSNSATGYIDGAFYGPNAENLGAIWSLSDGTASALGTVGAAR